MCGTKKNSGWKFEWKKKVRCCWKRKKQRLLWWEANIVWLFSLYFLFQGKCSARQRITAGAPFCVFGGQKKNKKKKQVKIYERSSVLICKYYWYLERSLYCLHVVWVCNITLRVQQAVSLTQAQQWEGIALQKFNLVQASLQSLSFLPVLCAAKAGSHGGRGLLFTCVGVYKSISEDWEWHERQRLTEYKWTEIRRCRWRTHERCSTNKLQNRKVIQRQEMHRKQAKLLHRKGKVGQILKPLWLLASLASSLSFLLGISLTDKPVLMPSLTDVDTVTASVSLWTSYVQLCTMVLENFNWWWSFWAPSKKKKKDCRPLVLP